MLTSSFTEKSNVWRLVWSDEFSGAAGSRPDITKWSFDAGAGTWGNAELETYTSAPANVSLDGNGNLVITALRLPDGKFTSGRINTADKFQTYLGKVEAQRAQTRAGKRERNTLNLCPASLKPRPSCALFLEARIKIPYGQGLWPAFWMLGADIKDPGVGWPNCGEIDIMENIGREPGTVYGTIHGPGYSGKAGISGHRQLPSGQRLADEFHIYAMEWTKDSITFFLDGVQYQRVTPADLPAGSKWVFDHPFFLILNVAVGGTWPGFPDSNTTFPQRMLVDYVRVYRR